MVIGGYISAAGLGLTCPDWPLCPNGLLPDDEYFIEWLHRLIAATTGALVIATAVGWWSISNRHITACRVGIHTFWYWNIAFCNGSVNYIVCIQATAKIYSDYVDFALRLEKYT